MQKRFITEAEHTLDGFRLGTKIYASGLRPTFIVGLWRGGSAVGIVVQECLQTLGVHTNHIALRTSYEGRSQYEAGIKEQRDIRVHGKQYLLEHANRDDVLLIVDDVYSSGRHTQAVVDALSHRLKRNMPEQVATATIWRRTTRDNTGTPDFHLYDIDDWLVLPYEMQGLTQQEIAEHKPWLLPLI